MEDGIARRTIIKMTKWSGVPGDTITAQQISCLAAAMASVFSSQNVVCVLIGSFLSIADWILSIRRGGFVGVRTQFIFNWTGFMGQEPGRMAQT
jgi:hypothetical protein